MAKAHPNYIYGMKTILTIFFALTLGTAFGQFIPQPMGYNPDVNGDEFIGVDDVMGTLALYDNPFENGDSLIVTSMTFPNDYGDVYGGWQNSVPYIYLDEETDFIYLHQTEDREVNFWLPQGPGFKVMQFFFSSDIVNWGVRIFLDTSEGSDIGGSEFYIQPANPVHMTLIRGHNGKWYQPGVTP